MNLKFENEREAFLAVLSVVVGADQVGSLAERDFLFKRAKSLPLFAEVELAEFSRLLGGVTQTVYEALPNDGGAITSSGLDQLLGAVKRSLSPSLHTTLLTVARELSESDEAHANETALLTQLERALG